MSQVDATVAGHRFRLDHDEVERRVTAELPEPIDDHYVVIAGRRYPPKQVVALVTGLDRADFNSHQARAVLARLGFNVGRRSSADSAGAPELPAEKRRLWPHGGREADALRAFAGRFVAQRGLEVLVAADDPREVLAWLERHRVTADAVFEVPTDPSAAGGGAPR